MVKQLVGIREKIDRANQCIVNLDGEIKAFFSESPYPFIPHYDDKLFDEAVNYHLGRPVPLRFSILAGEIAHHLRSCLDHLVWQLSALPEDAKERKLLLFPVFEIDPAKENKVSFYERKVKGLSEGAEKFVRGFQPYMIPPARENPLFILNEMDIMDKHRELVIIFPAFQRKLGRGAFRAFMEYNQRKSLPAFENLQVALKADSEVAPQVAFGQIGEWKDKAVIPCLAELSSYVSMVIDESERLFK